MTGMHLRRLLLLPASLLLAAPAAAQDWWEPYIDLPGGVHVIEVDSLIRFDASTAAEVQQSIQQIGGRGRRGAGHRFRRSIDYRWEELPSGECRMGDVQILLRSVLMMPEFENIAEAEPVLQRQWQVYRRAILDHELAHRELMERTYTEFRDELMARPAAPCREARNALPQIVVDMQNELREEQRALDMAAAGDRDLVRWPPRDPSAEPLWWEPYRDLPGGVHVLPVDSFYTFEATHPRQIKLNMDAFGPKVDGEAFYGLHKATWTYDFTWDRSTPGVCGIEDLRILVRSVITMPQVADPAALEPEVRAQWDQYYTALRIHELGHRNIMEAHLVALRERVLQEPPRPCQEWEAPLDEIFSRVSPELRAQQEGYDDRTDHGRTEGAVWPPPVRR